MPDPSDLDQVKAANHAYYAALSARDLAAMERVWTATPQDVNIAPPIRPVAHAGWDAVRANYQSFWASLEELTVSMSSPNIHIEGSVAWVYGIEHVTRTVKGGHARVGTNFGTSIFLKQEGCWRMVFHHAAAMPEANDSLPSEQ